ncbi:MAG TPA: NAD(P)/FAD-dependent oxidoreductase [Candidatus Nanopelagicales bacterium]|nr:NAD(P)/FAD-dependent oxidoreductase [Candidatus Nanopelagicales bacterium]
MKDVIVVGGGIAGLSAAWRLRHRDLLLLESGGRVGGRIRSERRGQYWLNWGAHVYAGQGSSTGWLLEDAGVDVTPILGSLSAIAMNGTLLVRGRVETYPFRIPMSNSSRIALVKASAKVGTAVAKYARIVRQRPGESAAARQQRIYDFMNDQTFAEFVGDLPPDAEALFKPTVTRSAADLDEISAGAGVGYFSLVWGIGGGLTNAIVGGASTLTETVAAGVGDAVRLNAVVHEVVQNDASVTVRWSEGGEDHEIEARYVVMATPATVTHEVTKGLDSDIHEALGRIVYGPYVSAAFLTDETGPQVWDDAYAIATPNRSFNIALNHSNIVRGTEGVRRPGSSIMTFSPASLARGLLEHDDAEITRRYVADLDDILPGFAGHVVESHIQRWPTGAPYCFPGRAKLQPTLTRRGSRVLLAGDYLGTLYTETAISSGLSAAQEIQSQLASESQRRGRPSTHDTDL